MYMAGIILSFKLALLITIFSIFMELRKTAKAFRRLGLGEYAVKRFYRENIASSCTSTAQVTLVLGTLFSVLATALIWIAE